MKWGRVSRDFRSWRDQWPDDTMPRRWGFGYAYSADERAGLARMSRHVVWMPYWFVLSVGLAPTAIALFNRALPSRRRRRLAAEGRCVCCGYDLRASSERCPECGTSFSPTVATPSRPVQVEA